ncbi:MAG: polyribonucleotide nucleotidyltransferase [Flavobacteriales bacterium]|nr:polyribonucleotide nucleotidyltransferase [Flavobacteriales bacterium]MCX7767632.1 polyribonucleotide nucleotidyltransferase [Flavobacteriales bacterium]MDW8409526.1 polyribonucleotide nucleotidyltransferase [Flavobacteriales bacterium]
MSHFDIKQVQIPTDSGIPIILETGHLARQADGAVLLRYGNTMLLATAVSQTEPKAGVDFFPLTVEYREKFAAAGRIPGGFFKREARPSDNEVLISRLIDRALRPLFPENYQNETQIFVNLISADKNTPPDALACLAASAALVVSDIPFNGPVSEVRVALFPDGQYLINPSQPLLESARLDLIVGGTEKDIVMVEGEAREVSEQELLKALEVALEAIRIQVKAQKELAAMVPKAAQKREVPSPTRDEALLERLRAEVYPRLYEIFATPTPHKKERKEALQKVKDEFLATLSPEELAEKGPLALKYINDLEWEAARKAILITRRRMDGRALEEIRPISIIPDFLPAAHGSALFTRGETQSVTTVTLGTKLDEQIIDLALHRGTQRFMFHYNFPPFSTGEVKPIRGVSRREIGHGNLALRALYPLVEEVKDNPYTIRVVSDILESNGSSSMATVCAGSLALMDAGIKIREHVSGIAMGLITDSDGNYAILSDILGDEDHLGDMDFKICGTRKGITACQMDIKVQGLSFEILAKALEQARQGRLFILEKMEAAQPAPRPDFKPFVPRIVKIVIPRDTIGQVIGPGGKIIQDIQNTTGTTIIVDEVDGQGVVEVAGETPEAIEAALRRIKAIVAVPEIGETYEGKVVSNVPFGSFIEFLPGKQGLCHISELDWKRVDSADDVVKVGDTVKVKLIGTDEKTGKFKLSRKALLPRPETLETNEKKKLAPETTSSQKSLPPKKRRKKKRKKSVGNKPGGLRNTQEQRENQKNR